MGKASSSKKVARAAGTGGGRTSGGRRPVGYYTFVTVVVVLGSFLLVFSRNNMDTASAEPPTTKDHWHTAYGIYICGAFVPAPEDKGQDRLGIHTHGDGLIHVHPFSKAATGKGADFGKFVDQTGLKLSSTELGVAGQKTYKNGDKCDGKKGEVKAVVWENEADKTGQFVGGDPSDILLKQGKIITLAFVPEGTKVGDIPQPASVSELANPSDLQQDGGTPPSAPEEGTPPSTEVSPDSSDPAPSTTAAP